MSADETKILRELALLQVDEGVLYRPFATLSQGEKTKLLLAAGATCVICCTVGMTEEHGADQENPTPGL